MHRQRERERCTLNRDANAMRQIHTRLKFGLPKTYTRQGWIATWKKSIVRIDEREREFKTGQPEKKKRKSAKTTNNEKEKRHIERWSKMELFLCFVLLAGRAAELWRSTCDNVTDGGKIILFPVKFHLLLSFRFAFETKLFYAM